MKFNLKKLTSLMTASLLTAGGLVGLSALPASATDAPAPALLLDYENSTLVQSPWPSLAGWQFSGDGDNGWVNYVPNSAQTGGSTGSTKMLKAAMGSGSYSGVFIAKTTTDSLLSAAHPVVSMKLYSPSAGKIVRMTIQSGDYPSIQGAKTVDATTLTVVGWQTLRFDFSTANPDYTLVLNRAFIDFDPASTAAGPDIYIDDVSFNGAATPARVGHATAPAHLYDFESETLVSSPWPSLPGYQFSGDGDNGWINYVPASDKPGGVVGSTKILKVVLGSGAYSGAFVAKTTTSSLLSASAPLVSMRFWSPAAGKTVNMTIQSGDYPSIQGAMTVAATAVTVQGWQTLYFDFSGSNPDYSLIFNRAFIDYDPSVTTASPDLFIDNVSFNENGISSGVVQQAPQTVDYDVRLVSSQRNTATDAYQWTSCNGAGWCANNNYYMKMIAAGASTTLTYVVTQHGTSTAVASASVSLRMNTAYSGSNATWSSNSTNFGAVSTGTSTDAGTITGTSNSSGEVSFTFTNTNTNGEAARTLNNATPYPSGCDSPAGQTKAALQPEVTAVSGAVVGTQYVDVLWPHISSSTINTSIAAGSDGQNCPAPTVPVRPGTKVWSPAFDANNAGHYPHIRVEKSFLNEKLDGTWWDGVWQYRDADTRAYLKYAPVGSTFALTYTVTNEYGQPYEGAKVSLIVNANYSCSKTFFAYEGSLIGPDDCAGGGQTELPAKIADSKGRVTFVLTNTNTTGEAMPADLNGAPNSATKELGTNIKPHVVGATQEGIDMLFMHFVEPAGAAKVTGSTNQNPTVGTVQASTFTFTDESGKPVAKTDVRYFINGFDSKVGFATTDANGQVTIQSKNSAGMAGVQTVGVSLTRDGKLPLAGTVKLNWTAPELAIQAAGAKGSVLVKVMGAAGKTVSITVAGKTFTRSAKSASEQFSIPAGAGKKSVKVVVDDKTLSKAVTVTK